MTGKHLGARLVLVSGLLLTGLAANARAVYEEPWVEARSPSFVIYSQLDADKTVEVAQQLEDFAQLVGMLTTLRTTRARVPTYLYIFNSAEASAGLTRDIKGRFLPAMRANYASARPAAGVSLTQVLQHEYTHFLLHNNDHQQYPRWLDEGFAELLSTADIRKGRFTFGDGSRTRIPWLANGSWVPFTSLLDEEKAAQFSRERVLMFYAQSWALTHYLMMGPKAKEFPARIRDYLRRLELREPPIAAFELAFGEDASQLGSVIEKYLKRYKMLAGTLTKPFPRQSVALRTMSPSDAAAALGVLALNYGSMEDSSRYFDAAVALDPANTEALVGQAEHLSAAGRYREAEPLYRRAIELAPTNDHHLLDFGEFWHRQVDKTKDPAEAARLTKLARQQYAAAFKLNEANPETLAAYGSSFLGTSEVAKGLDTLELANQLLPASTYIKLNLARMYVALDRPADARPLLQAVVAWSHGGAVEAAEELLAGIDGRKP